MTEPRWQSAHDANIPSKQDQHVLDILAAIERSAANARSVLPRAFRVLRDAQNGTAAAQHFDTIGGGKTGRTWCWEHGDDYRTCQTDGRLYCDTETIIVNDPVGEAALVTDRAAHATKDIHRKAQRAKRAIEELASAIEDAAPRQRPPTDKDRRTTAADNTPGCASCAQVEGSPGIPLWSPVSRPQANPGGNLPEPVDQCESCYQRTRTVGHAPTKAEREHLLRLGKWPRVAADA